MPDERFIHPGEGESDKLTQLTDFEYRVWDVYKLAANDVGVMLDSPAPIQTVNRNLRNRPVKDIRKALDSMLRLELLIRFKHGGEHYVCSPLWQDWQMVKYPRETHMPLPDDGDRARCSDVTRQLFALLESKRRAKRDRLLKDSEPLGNISKDSEAATKCADVGSESSLHVSARNANANANANASEERADRRPIALSGDLPRDHLDHAFCWLERSMCVPRRLHEDFIRKFGGDRAAADGQLRAFYARTKARFGEREPIHEADRFKFWTAQYTEWRRVPQAPNGGMAVPAIDATAAMVAAKLSPKGTA